MMTSQHWISKTKRGLLVPRSDLLIEIDNAFMAYDQARTGARGSTKELIRLFEAVMNWINSKGSNWRSSTRNSYIENGGKGTVETLLRELITLNRIFEIKAASALGTGGPPPPPLMQHGVIQRQKDEDGHWYHIPIQQEENSCGPASVKIVIKLTQNKDVGEEYLRELAESAEEANKYKGSMGQGGALKAGGSHNWNAGGGGTWMVPQVLKAAKINCHMSKLQQLLLTTSRKNPAIAVVAWDAGGLHYVVVAGYNTARTKLIILDPLMGVQSVPVNAGILGPYQPVNQLTQATIARGSWHPWVCKVD